MKEKSPMGDYLFAWLFAAPVCFLLFCIPLAAIGWLFTPEDFGFGHFGGLGQAIVYGIPFIIAIWMALSYPKIQKEEAEKKEKKKKKKISDNRKRLKAATQKAAATLVRQKSQLTIIREELDILAKDVECSTIKSLEKHRKKYHSLVETVKKEQDSLRDLTERHPLISSFLKSQNMDDLDSKVFLELKAKLGNNP
jgi:Na+-transporting methylmalonyl-CoA/oxaloacetate decarboxylase gamma subunit|tara:strand:- start:496 stop:1080 length:585 start_codon:yes stop_codon:yes gene_type:complete